MVVGIHKGSAFELKIYKNLRELGECKRTIGSGSSDETADIHFKNYSIECKHLKEVRWKNLTQFWNKLNKDIGMKKEEPIIVFRQNREPIMVMCRMNYKGKNIRAITSYNIWKQIVK